MNPPTPRRDNLLIVDLYLFNDGAVDKKIWALLTKSQWRVSDTELTIKAFCLIVSVDSFSGQNASISDWQFNQLGNVSTEDTWYIYVVVFIHLKNYTALHVLQYVMLLLVVVISMDVYPLKYFVLQSSVWSFEAPLRFCNFSLGNLYWKSYDLLFILHLYEGMWKMKVSVKILLDFTLDHFAMSRLSRCKHW